LRWTRGSGSYQRGPFGRCSCCSTTATGRAFEASVRTSVRTSRPDIVRRGELGCHVDATRGIDDGDRLAAGAVLPPLVLGDDEASPWPSGSGPPFSAAGTKAVAPTPRWSSAC